MSKARLLLAACFTMFAFSALASATASATGGAWMVNGTLLVGTAALANGLVLSFGTLSALGVEVQCKAHEVLINGGLIEHPDWLLAKDLTFHECGVLNAGSNCKLPNSNNALILTLAVHGLALLDPGAPLNTLILLLPLPSKTFAVIPFEGEKCALLGNQPVTGDVDLLIHEGRDEKLLHLVLVLSLPGLLKVGSSEAELHGLDFDIRLASDLPWSFL